MLPDVVTALRPVLIAALPSDLSSFLSPPRQPPSLPTVPACDAAPA
jgi:hypothetical protein